MWVWVLADWGEDEGGNGVEEDGGGVSRAGYCGGGGIGGDWGVYLL